MKCKGGHIALACHPTKVSQGPCIKILSPDLGSQSPVGSIYFLDLTLTYIVPATHSAPIAMTKTFLPQGLCTATPSVWDAIPDLIFADV
jgi:hypothetical protein